MEYVTGKLIPTMRQQSTRLFKNTSFHLDQICCISRIGLAFWNKIYTGKRAIATQCQCKSSMKLKLL